MSSKRKRKLLSLYFRDLHQMVIGTAVLFLLTGAVLVSLCGFTLWLLLPLAMWILVLAMSARMRSFARLVKREIRQKLWTTAKVLVSSVDENRQHTFLSKNGTGVQKKICLRTANGGVYYLSAASLQQAKKLTGRTVELTWLLESGFVIGMKVPDVKRKEQQWLQTFYGYLY